MKLKLAALTLAIFARSRWLHRYRLDQGRMGHAKRQANGRLREEVIPAIRLLRKAQTSQLVSICGVCCFTRYFL